jgi:hypothetical protein
VRFADLQRKVKPQGIVELSQGRSAERPQQATDPLNGDRPDLFRLNFGIAVEAGVAGTQMDLEVEDPPQI